MFRDAEASGSRRIRRVTARYGGQVRTPDLDGKQYIGIYEAIEETMDTIPETERTEQTERGTDGTAGAFSSVRSFGQADKLAYTAPDGCSGQYDVFPDTGSRRMAFCTFLLPKRGGLGKQFFFPFLFFEADQYEIVCYDDRTLYQHAIGGQKRHLFFFFHGLQLVF